MKRDRIRFVALIVGAALLAVTGGYLISRMDKSAPEGTPRSNVDTEPVSADSARQDRPLYYKDPDGRLVYSATPKKTSDGRDFVAVFEEKPAVGSVARGQKNARPKGKGKILYYRNPMGLPDTSSVPKKDPMGMDYIPVYENEAAVETGLVQLSPGRVQLLGVRTGPVEMRSLARSIQATGIVTPDERGLAVVTTKVSGWIETLKVSAVGDPVRRGETLLELYSPDLVTAEQEYLVAKRLSPDVHAVSAHVSAGALLDAALARLRALGISENEINRLQRTGEASRLIPIVAPADGVVIEKQAIAGMRVESNMALYKTADLSTVWLLAEVPEQTLGLVRPGQPAHASFVAFPGRRFEGKVDFIYPVLSPETRTGKVRIVIPNQDFALRAEMFATVAIETLASAAAVLSVPDSAIIDSGNRQVALVARGEGRYEPRTVTLGTLGEGYVEVLSGLRKGEQIVIGANFLIDAESNLRAALQAIAPQSGGGSQ